MADDSQRSMTQCAGAAMLMAASAIFTGHVAGQPQERPVAPASGATTTDVDAAVARGVAWLVAQQDSDGGFRAGDRAVDVDVDIDGDSGGDSGGDGDGGGDGTSARRLATSCLALHALASEPMAPDDAVERAMSYVLAHVDERGWVGSGSSGLAWRVTGAAAGALRAALARHDAWCTTSRVRTLHTLELSAVNHAPESWADARRDRSAPVAPAAVARTLDDSGDGAVDDAAAARAIAFLERVGGDVSTPAAVRSGVLRHDENEGGFTYDDLLQLTHRPQLAPDDALVRRGVAALRESFTVTRNPDLARRFPDSSEAGGAGRYHYLMIAARVLAHSGSPQLECADGRVVEWADAIRATLLADQQRDGSWRNHDGGRWWEDDPVLTTAFALRTLQYCDLVRE